MDTVKPNGNISVIVLSWKSKILIVSMGYRISQCSWSFYPFVILQESQVDV